MSAEEPVLVIATNEYSATIGLQMIARGTAWGVVFFEDRPDGNISAQYFVGPGHEHRFDEIEKLIAATAERGGCTVVDPLHAMPRGAA